MALSWITPKTDWDNTSKFTYADYNRIRNNLLYINEKLNEMYPDVAVELDLGNPKTGYADRYYPSEFNGFEEALESFKRTELDVNIGDKKTYKGNDPFITYDELNRIEKCCLRWKDAQPSIQSVTITPSKFGVGIGETVQLSVSVIPNDIQYTVAWSSSDASIGTVASDGTVTGVFGGEFTITATITYKGKTYTATAVGAVLAGSFFEFDNNSYYYDLVYLGSNLDGNGLATLIGRYATDALKGGWRGSGSLEYTDANAAYRTSIQTFIDSNFSTNLKGALQNATKVVLLDDLYKGVTTTNLTAKYFLLAANEVGLGSVYIKPSPLGGVIYSYLLGNASRIDGDILQEDPEYPETQRFRDRWQQVISGHSNLASGGEHNGAMEMIGVSQNAPLRPLFFLNSSLMVRANANADGSYSIDWTGKSGKALGSLPVGTIIRDDSGTR